MLKFFAKYQKILLVVGGSILMVIFLLPAGGRFLQPNAATQPVGRADGEAITNEQETLASTERTIIQRLVPNAGVPIDDLQWVLLVREARQNGIYVSQSEAEQVVDQLQASGVKVNDQLSGLNVTKALVLKAISDSLMMQSLTKLAAMPVQPSEPRLAHLVQNVRAQATVQAVAIDAASLESDTTKPTDQQLKDLYNQYREDAPGKSEPWGFGYRLPDRVKLEYISVPIKRVKDSVTVDEVDAQKYYTTHPDEFMPADKTKSDDKSKTDDKSADKTADAAKKTDDAARQPLPYRKVRQRVIDKLTDQQAQAKQTQIMQQIAALLAEHRRTLSRDPQDYVTLTKDYKPLDFESIAKQIQKQFGVLADVVRVEDHWLDMAQVRKLEGFGDTSLEYAGRGVDIAEYIESAKAFSPKLTNPLIALKLQTGVASRVVADNDGNDYIFRLLDANPAHVPASLDEVRVDVERDAKRLEAYKLLKQRTQKLLDAAQQQGMDKFADAHKTKVATLGPFSGLDITRMMYGIGNAELPTLPLVGQSQPFVSAVFDLGAEVQQAGGLDKANDAAKTGVVALDKEQKVVVFKLTAYTPVTIDVYEQFKPALTQLLARLTREDALTPGAASPLSLPELKKRMKYVAVEPVKSSAPTNPANAPSNPLGP